MTSNPFMDPSTREQHVSLCAADAFQYSQAKGLRGISENRDSGGLHRMSLTALACEIRDEAADQTIYASQLANGVITELSETLVAIGKALDEAEEGDAVGQAKKLIAKALILVR